HAGVGHTLLAGRTVIVVATASPGCVFRTAGRQQQQEQGSDTGQNACSNLCERERNPSLQEGEWSARLRERYRSRLGHETSEERSRRHGCCVWRVASEVTLAVGASCSKPTSPGS